MSMYQSAEKINKDIKDLFGSININEFTLNQREMILNIIIRFGAIAKFRCRSNVAYDNFVTACLKDVATLDRVKIDSDDKFEVLRATIKKPQFKQKWSELTKEDINKVLNTFSEKEMDKISAEDIINIFESSPDSFEFKKD